MDCVFCSIAEKKIPSSIVYEDDQVVAFHDIHPEAPVHILIIPKKHIQSLALIAEENKELMAGILYAAANIAKEQGIEENGYRVVTNIGNDGGQTVGHLHFHLLGGRSMKWPPG